MKIGLIFWKKVSDFLVIFKNLSEIWAILGEKIGKMEKICEKWKKFMKKVSDFCNFVSILHKIRKN